MNIIINLLFSGLAVLVTTYIIPGVEVNSFWVAIVVAIVLGVVNAFVRPIVTLLTLPVNILTLGLFSFVITALMVMLTGAIVPGFVVTGFVPALLFGVVESLVSWVLFKVVPDKD